MLRPHPPFSVTEDETNRRVQIIEQDLSSFSRILPQLLADVHRKWRDDDSSLANRARAFIEEVINIIHDLNEVETKLANTLNSNLESRWLKEIAPPAIIAKMTYIKILGNEISHGIATFSPEEHCRLLNDCCFIGQWLAICNATFSEQNEMTSDGISPSLSRGMQILGRRINNATDNQKSVLNDILSKKTTIVSGVAGSGKTLLAMEVATRFSQVGMKSLILCHSKNLKEFIEESLIFTTAQVACLNEFDDVNQSWSPFYQPSSDVLLRNLKILLTEKSISVIIIDEGQDINDNLINDIIDLSDFLNIKCYVFLDRDQAINYADGTKIDKTTDSYLSANCRNAREIIGLCSPIIRKQIPQNFDLSGGLGRVEFCSKHDISQFIGNMIREARSYNLNALSLIHLNCDVPDNSSLNNTSVTHRSMFDWHAGVKFLNSEIVKHQKLDPRNINARPDLWLIDTLQEGWPDENEIERVQSWAIRVARRLGIPVEGKGKVRLSWNYSAEGNRPFTGIATLPFILKFFSGDQWHETLGVEREYHFRSECDPLDSRYIPLHSPFTVKGLEYDGVIAVVDGLEFLSESSLYISGTRARLWHAFLVDEQLRHHPLLRRLAM